MALKPTRISPFAKLRLVVRRFLGIPERPQPIPDPRKEPKAPRQPLKL